MKIFSAKQIKQLDQFTILHEPISSIDLMERASGKFVEWIVNHFSKVQKFKVFCGPGNNGGDGLAIARLLGIKGYNVATYIVECKNYSEDFRTNLRRICNYKSPFYIRSNEDFPEISDKDIVIDSLFGSGLSRPLSGIFSELVYHINLSKSLVVSVDIASGLYCDDLNNDPVKINADYTLTFQLPKLSLLLPSNEINVGTFEVIDINLNKSFIKSMPSNSYYVEKSLIKEVFKKREKFSHKGTFGKAAILAGKYGSIGAAVLAVKACYRSGAGLVYSYLPSIGVNIMQSSIPEAIVVADPGEKYLTVVPDVRLYDSIGIGPGISEGEEAVDYLRELFEKSESPLVIDASALNLIAENKFLLDLIPAGSILTPHPKEFERLKGKAENDYHRLALLKELAEYINGYVVLKGAHTVTATFCGELYFNSTGNPGMATGGSGDVLTGIITGLLAQKYSPRNAAILGVFLHGFAGDVASKRTGQGPLLATDIIEGMKDFFLEFEKY